MNPVISVVSAMLLVGPPAAAAENPRIAALAAALRDEDLPAVRVAVASIRQALGDKAGVPEVADQYVVVPTEARILTAAETRGGFAMRFEAIRKTRWWRVGADPGKLAEPLRVPASVVAGCAAAVRAKLDGADDSRQLANEAAEFLMWAQEQGGRGLYPFPAARGTSEARSMVAGEGLLRKAEAAGTLDRIVHAGWIIDDPGDGGLQFDNAECGVAMFEWHDLTKDPRHLASARKAADWAVTRPLVPNWNYNGFSVWLLAKAFAATGERTYLEAAKRKARIGVIPGQLVGGIHAGRWTDPHNARPAYHYIMLRALARLAAVLPAEDPDRNEIVRCLELGLKARNFEFAARGVMNRDTAIETLLEVNRLFANDPRMLRETGSREALGVLLRAVSIETRRGRIPLAPREWGLLLEAIARGEAAS